MTNRNGLPHSGDSARRHEPRRVADARDAQAWEEFAAEVRKLLALDPDDMSAEEFDRFEAISDAFIHLLGYAYEWQGEKKTKHDQRLISELLRRDGSRRKKAQPPAVVFSDEDRAALRDRILAGLHAQQLRVREGDKAPSRTPLDVPQVASTELLRELESAHRALVVPELAVAAGVGHEIWDIECTTAVDVPAHLPRAPYVALQVVGASMEPLFQSGDLVLVHVGEKAEAGSVVVARDPDHGYVIKEVSGLTLHGIELRSLNPRFPSLHLSHGAGVVLGTVVLFWPRWSRKGPSTI
ncbi:MAG TPA: S24 family peptidase [Gemmatimonadaceae bacterium]|jgi:phage repressor protein C with HTH and peptisase S24 domain